MNIFKKNNEKKTTQKLPMTGKVQKGLQNQNILGWKLCYLRIRYSGILKKDGCSFE